MYRNRGSTRRSCLHGLRYKVDLRRCDLARLYRERSITCRVSYPVYGCSPRPVIYTGYETHRGECTHRFGTPLDPGESPGGPCSNVIWLPNFLLLGRRVEARAGCRMGRRGGPERRLWASRAVSGRVRRADAQDVGRHRRSAAPPLAHLPDQRRPRPTVPSPHREGRHTAHLTAARPAPRAGSWPSTGSNGHQRSGFLAANGQNLVVLDTGDCRCRERGTTPHLVIGPGLASTEGVDLASARTATRFGWPGSAIQT